MSLDTDPTPLRPPGAAGGEPDASDPASDRPAAPADRTAGRVAAACVVLAVLPIVVAAVRAVIEDWVAVGDNAFFAIRARDVLTEHHPLLGTWTSASLTLGLDVNNPGPLLFDALALPVKLGGDAGLAVGTALINVAAVAGIAVAARRQAGPRGVVVAMAAAAALVWALGSELLVDPWQPHSLLVPVLCYLVLVWALACGDLAVLPWAIGLASLVVQTHIGYALLVPILGAWGVGAASARLWRERRSGTSAWASRRRRVLRVAGASLVVALVCWAQPLYEQLFSDGQGNLSRLASGVTETQDKIGAREAPRFVAEIVALPPWWGRPSANEAFAAHTLLPSLGASVAGLLLVTVALVAGVAMGRRRRDRPGVMAAASGLVVLGVSVAVAATMPVGVLGVAAHHLRWLWPVAVFVTFALAFPLIMAPGRGTAARVGLALGALATFSLSVLALPAEDARLGPSADADAMPAIRTLLPQLAQLRDEPGVLFDVRGLRFAEPFSVPVMNELQQLGVPWFVDDRGMARQLGEDRAYSGGASVLLFLREGDAARETPAGAHRVAFADGLTEDETDELDALQEELRPFIAGGGIVLNDAALARARNDDALVRSRILDAGDAEVPSAEQLRDPDYLMSPGTASSRYLRRLVYLVAEDQLEVPDRWARPLQRYAELRQQADRLTVAVFTRPLEGE